MPNLSIIDTIQLLIDAQGDLMGKLTVLALGIVIAVVLAGSLFVQVWMVPLFSADLVKAKSAILNVKTPGTYPTPTPTEPIAPAADSAATKLNWGTPIAAGSDEFNYSGAPDSAKWNSYDTPGHLGAGRRMKAQSVVSDGFLTHTGLPNGDTGYVSSTYRPGTMYGNWEGRMRTNLRDSEYHPVMLLWPDTGAHITTEDEVDFAEGTWDTSRIQFYLHYGPAGSTTQTRAERVIDTTQWHNYAVSWSPTGVRYYLDGVLWFEDTEPSHNPGQPMHSAIQLDWFPDGTLLTESKMQVDWFRQYAPSTATATATLLIRGGSLMVAGVALIFLAMRTLLAQAVARDAEAKHLRSELDEVI